MRTEDVENEVSMALPSQNQAILPLSWPLSCTLCLEKWATGLRVGSDANACIKGLWLTRRTIQEASGNACCAGSHCALMMVKNYIQ